LQHDELDAFLVSTLRESPSFSAAPPSDLESAVEYLKQVRRQSSASPLSTYTAPRAPSIKKHCVRGHKLDQGQRRAPPLQACGHMEMWPCGHPYYCCYMGSSTVAVVST